MPSSETILLAYPLMIAARGMPLTTQRFFALRDGHAAGGLDRAQTFRAIFTHAGHQHADSGEAKFLRDGMKQNVDRWAMPIDGRSHRIKHGHVAARHAAHHHVAIARAQMSTRPASKKIAGLCFLNVERAALVETLGKHFGEAFGHVLHDQEWWLENPRESARAEIAVRWGRRWKCRWR